jgi:hypothetical protein
MKLSVDVRNAHLIEVDEGDRPYATPCEGFDRPRADPTEPYDTHRRAGDPFVGFLTNKLGKSHETVLV